MTKVLKTVKHSPVRLEAADKLAGKTAYTDDISLPNMAYAKVIRSEYANALVLAIDLKEAEKVPGYIAALLPDEVPQTLYNCSGNPPSALLLKDEKILTMQPKCAGDRILCIAAESPEACEAAFRPALGAPPHIVGLDRHGVVAVGKTPWEAFEHVERLEHICRIVLAAGQPLAQAQGARHAHAR